MADKELVRFDADMYAEVLSPKEGDILVIYGMVSPSQLEALRLGFKETHPRIPILCFPADITTEVVTKEELEKRIEEADALDRD